MLPPRNTPPKSKPPERSKGRAQTVVTAKRPHHLWHIDITTLGTTGGLSLPWFPFSLGRIWPFCWHIVVVVDHFTRALVAFGVYRQEPSSKQIARLLDRAAADAGAFPQHIVSDKGRQFQADYLAWCDKHQVRPRFGAVGKHGSIAVVERFIRSLKYEHLHRIPISLSRLRLQADLESYRRWYNEHRPHETLGGQTPREKLEGMAPAARRFEPRPLYPIPHDERRVQRCEDIELVASCVDAHRHLPVIELRASA